MLRDGKQVTELPRRDPALGHSAPHGIGVRRVRRRPPRRHVRHPARARGGGQADALGPEQGDAPPSLFPPVFDHQHGGTGRHHRAIYHGTQQINQGSDGPLEQPWRRSTTCPTRTRLRSLLAKVPAYDNKAGRKLVRTLMVEMAALTRDWLHQRRHLDRHVATHRHHVGRERTNFRATSPSPSASPSSTRRDEVVSGPIVAEYYQRMLRRGTTRMRPPWATSFLNGLARRHGPGRGHP